MKVAVVVGTRPQFIKLKPLVAAKPEGVHLSVLHTGQHYSPEMGEPGCEHIVLSPWPNAQRALGLMVAGLANELERLKPDRVLVIGDCRSTLAGALAAHEAGIPVAHLEAGLRCFAPTAEERIRRAVDHYSDLCLCPTQAAMDNLERERHNGRRVLVGDILVDAMQGQRVLVTMHRAENEDRIPQVAEALRHFDATWITHPRTGHLVQGVRTLPPQTPDEMLLLLARSAVVVTDSGGVSREAALLGKPVLLVRDSYEFDLPGVEPCPVAKLACAVGKRLETVTPLGDGKTAGRVWEELAR